MRIFHAEKQSAGEREMWYNVARHYTRADSRPTNGRTISQANRVHPAEHIMSAGHDIILKGKTSDGAPKRQ